MQTVNRNKMEAFAFVILCGGTSSKSNLKFCLERINKLTKKNTSIAEIIVYLVPISTVASYIKTPTFKKYMETLDNIEIVIVTGSTLNATEPRAYNYGLELFLSGNADYVTFLHESDVILDKNILEYYMWLFNTAHNKEVTGAVNLSSNVAVKKPPSKLAKMWYADDMYLRGACIRKQAIKDCGPFDECLLYRSFEWDLFNRMAHHTAWLTRVGKEKNDFIKFGGPDLTDLHKKMSILDKQSKVWFARKWHFKGIWPEEKRLHGNINCYIRKNTLYKDSRNGVDFFELFVLSEQEKLDLRERFKIIYADTVLNNSIKVSESFIKKPIGNFLPHHTFYDGVQIKNNREIQTHISCEITYWQDLLWDAKGVT